MNDNKERMKECHKRFDELMKRLPWLGYGCFKDFIIEALSARVNGEVFYR